MALEYNDERHEYLWDGQRVKSVTQVLGEWIQVKDFYVNVYQPQIIIAESAMRAAADHGTAVHQGANIILTSALQWDELDPSLVHPLQEFQRWLYDYEPDLVSTGYPMYSKRYGFAGTPDPFYLLKVGKRRVLCFVEIKTGAHLLSGPQLTGYVQLYRELSKFKGEIQRWVLELPKDKPYNFYQKNGRDDWSFFESCLFRDTFIRRLNATL